MNEHPLHKLPPQNLEAEQQVLGAVLVSDAEAMPVVMDELTSENFYKTAHKEIFTAMLRLFEKNESIDLITLPEALRGSGALESVGGASYLALLVSLVPTAANVRTHARIVREKSILHQAQKAAHGILHKIDDEQKPAKAQDVLEFAEQSIYNIGRSVSGGTLKAMQDIVGPAFTIIEKRYEDKGAITGVPTGFVDLDEKLSGLQPSDLILIAARPSMGKTAFALNIAAHAALNCGKYVALFSLEMSEEQLTLRLMSSEARVDAHHIRTGNLHERDWPRLADAAGRLAGSRIRIDDTAAISAMEIRSRSRRMKAEKGLDLIIVDYLQLMSGKGDEGNREQEVSGISRALKALAKDLKVPVVALSQLNRSVENRPANARRPTLSDLRESGALEQDADVILFIYREEVYTRCDCPADGVCMCNRRGTAEVIIGKQRNGPIGMVPLTFLNHLTRFENKESRYG